MPMMFWKVFKEKLEVPGKEEKKICLFLMKQTSNFFIAAFVLAADDLVTGKKGELPLKGRGFVTFKD